MADSPNYGFANFIEAARHEDAAHAAAKDQEDPPTISQAAVRVTTSRKAHSLGKKKTSVTAQRSQQAGQQGSTGLARSGTTVQPVGPQQPTGPVAAPSIIGGMYPAPQTPYM